MVMVCAVFCYCLLWLDVYICSDCVGVCGNVCCVADVLKNYVFSLGVVKYVVCLCKDVMGVVFSVCIVMRGPVGAHVWEV